MSSKPVPGVPAAARSGARPLRWIALVLAVLALAAALAAGLLPRLSAKEELRKQARELNVPTVAVIAPQPGESIHELVLPGNIEAYVDTPVYARTNGYLKRWLVDIGARVKAGQLLAEIETPEVDDQLQQARAELASAQANHQIAAKTAARWNELAQTGNVSKQDADQATSTMQARQAAVESARFNVSRLEKLQAFKRIYAPFDGVITARNVDVGALIDAGGGDNRALFRIAHSDRLRVYIQVPQAYSHEVVPGVPAPPGPSTLRSEACGRRSTSTTRKASCSRAPMPRCT
jgi:RND family efflux transporter MFP subunit